MQRIQNGDTTIFLPEGASLDTKEKNSRLNKVTLANGKMVHAYHGDSKLAKGEIQALIKEFAEGKTLELNIQGDWNIDWASVDNQKWLQEELEKNNLYIDGLSFPMDPSDPSKIWVREKKRLDGQNNAQWSKSGVTDIGIKDAAITIKRIADILEEKQATLASKTTEINAQFEAATAAQTAFKNDKSKTEAMEFGGENGLRLDHPVVSNNGVITVNLLSTQYTGLNPLEHKAVSSSVADIKAAKEASLETESLSNAFAAADYKKARGIFSKLFDKELGAGWKEDPKVRAALVKERAIKEDAKPPFEFNKVNSKFDKEHQAIFKYLMESLKDEPVKQEEIAKQLIKDYITAMYDLPEFKTWFDSWPEATKKEMCPISGKFDKAEIDAYAQRQTEALLAEGAGTIQLIISGRSDKVQSLRSMGILKAGILAKDARNPHEFEGMCLTPGSLVCGGFRPLPGKTQHENDCLQIKEVHEQLKGHEGDIHCIALQEYSSSELHSPVVDYYFEQIMEDPRNLKSKPEDIIKAYEAKTLKETKDILGKFDAANPKEIYKLMQQCAEKRLPASSEQLVLNLVQDQGLNKAFFVEYLLHNAKGPLPAKLAHEFLLENVFTTPKLQREFTTVIKALRINDDIALGACQLYKHHEDQKPLETIAASIENLEKKIACTPDPTNSKDTSKLKGMKVTLDTLKAEQGTMPATIANLNALRDPISAAAKEATLTHGEACRELRNPPPLLPLLRTAKEGAFVREKVARIEAALDDKHKPQDGNSKPRF